MLIGVLLLVQALGADYNMDVRVLGISGSSQMLLSEHGIDLSQWEQQYSGCALLVCSPYELPSPCVSPRFMYVTSPADVTSPRFMLLSDCSVTSSSNAAGHTYW